MSFPIPRFSSQDADFSTRLDALLAFESETDEQIEKTVAEIIKNVRTQGDAAVLDYTRRFDQLDAQNVSSLELPRSELAAAFSTLPDTQREALEQAATRIRLFHERQKTDSWRYEETAVTLAGTRLGQKVTPSTASAFTFRAAKPATLLRC